MINNSTSHKSSQRHSQSQLNIKSSIAVMFDLVSSPLKLCRSIMMGWNNKSNGKCHAAIKLFVGVLQAFGKETLAAAFLNFLHFVQLDSCSSGDR